MNITLVTDIIRIACLAFCGLIMVAGGWVFTEMGILKLIASKAKSLSAWGYTLLGLIIMAIGYLLISFYFPVLTGNIVGTPNWLP
ncbi:hypothetical protein KJ836_01670 [Patescibacteria group bacterium]|nr:hypothetical protein [Patescibacteria group bacterium]